jgi:hypothetical protein
MKKLLLVSFLLARASVMRAGDANWSMGTPDGSWAMGTADNSWSMDDAARHDVRTATTIVGWTMQQVLAAFGQPDYVSTFDSYRGHSEVWTYSNVLRVTFENSIVSTWSTYQ